jgi:hypothetical protein
MNISSIESSLFKILYDSLEVPFSIKIVENATYIDFKTYSTWIAIDSLTHSTGSIPKALYFLHIATKDGKANDIQVLNRVVDKVLAVINQGARINVYDDSSEALIGEMEVCETSLSPVIKHPAGGNYRSLTVGLVYAGEIPA